MAIGVDYITASIASKLDRRNDFVLMKEIEFHVKTYAVTYKQRYLQRNGYYPNFFQTASVPLVYTKELLTATSQLCDSEVNMLKCAVLRSENKLPAPIRYGNPEPFHSVYSFDGKAFKFASMEETRLLKHIKFGNIEATYDYVDNYLYMFNDVQRKRVLVRAPFEDPSLLSTIDPNCENCNINEDLALPDDYVSLIIADVMKLYLPTYQPNGKEASEINING